jgi:hypothetical protein
VRPGFVHLPILPLHHDRISESGQPTSLHVIEKEQESGYSSQVDRTEADARRHDKAMEYVARLARSGYVDVK